MRICTIAALLLCLPGTTRSFAGDAPPQRETPPLRVLFIGNSFTYGNDLPGIVAAMAEARGHAIQVGASLRGGYTLEKHVTDGKAVEMIRGRKWDVVVLQEQSFRPVSHPDKMLLFARTLHEEVAKQDARTLLFLTWAYRDQPKMQPALDKAYLDVAKKLGAKVAPVGPAWHRALVAAPEQTLHAKDGRHPNPAGSYLGACVFYAVLFDQSPMGLPVELHKGEKTLVKLTTEEAGSLQKIAWETVEGQKQSEQ
jgi:hypothetical protein